MTQAFNGPTAISSALEPPRCRPRLSVVVPVYNVEAYLAECLDSILAQSYDPLEVVIVDDGSTDHSASVARRYAERHTGIRLVATPNRGLGVARNRGVAEASGELLAFADSDDTVAPGAYERLVGALERSGSDFATGSMQRYDGIVYDEPRWMRRLHARVRLGVRVDDCPEILGDVFAWNKVFRRSFWERETIAFPEGVRYEDQVALTHAYLTADAFDVVPEPVYNWRIRSDGSAITERRQELEDLRDRVRTKRTVFQTVRALGSPEVQKAFREWVLPGDLWRYFAYIPDCEDEYWDVLHQAVREFWRDGALVRSRLTAANRLTGWLVGQNRRRDAETVIAHIAEHGDDPPKVVANGDVLAAMPYWDDPEANIPLDLYRLRPDELGWDADAVNVLLNGDVLILRGTAGFHRVPGGDALVRVVLTAGDGTTVTSGRGAADGFEARFDLTALLDQWPPDVRDAPRVWRVDVEWQTDAFRHVGTFTRTSLEGPVDGSGRADRAGSAGAEPDEWGRTYGGLRLCGGDRAVGGELAATTVGGAAPAYVTVAFGASGLRVVAIAASAGLERRTA